MKELLLTGLTLLWGGIAAFAQTDALEGWTKVSELPENLTDYYFVLADADEPTLILESGEERESGPKGKVYHNLYYQTISGTPVANDRQIWEIKASAQGEEWNILHTVNHPQRFVMCEWQHAEQAAINYGDDAAREDNDNYWNSYRITVDEAEGYFTVESHAYQGNWWGVNEVAAGEKFYGNKSYDAAAHFTIYAIGRDAYDELKEKLNAVPVTDEEIEALIATMPEGKMNADVKKEMDDAKAELLSSKTKNDYIYLQECIAAARESVKGYDELGHVLGKYAGLDDDAKAVMDEAELGYIQEAYDDCSMGNDELKSALNTYYATYRRAVAASRKGTVDMSGDGTDMTEELLTESGDFSRSEDSPLGRFGTPMYWTVENYRISTFQGDEQSVRNGIDNYPGSNCLALGIWSDNLIPDDRSVLRDSRIYQKVTLTAGKWFFGASFNSNDNIVDGYIYVSEANHPTNELRQNAIAYAYINKMGTNRVNGIEFTIDEEKEVILGFQLDASLSAGGNDIECRIREVNLTAFGGIEELRDALADAIEEAQGFAQDEYEVPAELIEEFKALIAEALAVYEQGDDMDAMIAYTSALTEGMNKIIDIEERNMEITDEGYILPNNTVEGWVMSNNADGELLHINTWSGDQMERPFLEHWHGQPWNLTDKTILYTMDYLMPGEYEVSAEVRARDESNSGTPEGLYFTVAGNLYEFDDPEEAEQGWQQTISGTGVAGADGKLTFGFKLEEASSLNWFSWRNVTVTLVELHDGIATVAPVQQNGATYDLSGRRVEKAVKGIYIKNGQKFVVK